MRRRSLEAKYLKVLKKELVGKTYGFYSYGENLTIAIHLTKDFSYILCPRTGATATSYQHGVASLLVRRIIWSSDPDYEEEDIIKEVSLEALLTAKSLGFRKAAKAVLKLKQN